MTIVSKGMGVALFGSHGEMSLHADAKEVNSSSMIRHVHAQK